jgi:hypothetical protein
MVIALFIIIMFMVTDRIIYSTYSYEKKSTSEKAEETLDRATNMNMSISTSLDRVDSKLLSNSLGMTKEESLGKN